MSPGDGTGVRRDRKRARLAARCPAAPVGPDELHVFLDAEPAGRRQDARRSTILERVVERFDELAAHDEVDDQRRDDDYHRDRRADDERDPCPKAHCVAGLSAYPTPRIVWIRRGLSPALGLRRR